MKILFWISTITILYTYIGYPILIYLLSLFYKKSLKGKYMYPNVSVVISAYNEEANIEKKIKSLLSLDYPRERFEILIGSDGSTDKTDEIIRGFEKDGVRLFRRDQRSGKPAMLNFLVPHTKGDILIFADARQRIDVNAFKELVKHFADPKVGSVSSALFYSNGEDAHKTEVGIGLYWKYEKFIRKSESRMGSMLGATGALYAIRKELFTKLPDDLLLDDVYVPLKIVEKGFRAIFDSKAKVYDRVFKNPKEEFTRRVRTLAGNYQLFYYLKGLFNPFKGKISWQFFSHKLLRLLVPFLLMAVFLSNLFLLREPLYKMFFFSQLAFCFMAILGKFSKHKIRIFEVPYMFCVMNLAAVVGLYRFVFKKQEVRWEKVSV